MDIKEIIDSATEEVVKNTLAELLENYMNPAFGALPKNEVELLMLAALENLGAINEEPKLYELVSKLKVTRAKARSLIYDRELRRSSTEELDEKVKDLLKRPLIQKNGDLYVLEVENPLVSDHLRSKVQSIGHVSDGSFSPSVVKLGLDAITGLISSYLTDDEKQSIQKTLEKAGFPSDSAAGAIKAVLKKLASTIASETGEALVEKASEFITPLMNATFEEISERAKDIFKQ